jgi:membrane-associated phospholipid phosphatase
MVLAVAVALAMQGWRRGALVWLFVVAGTFTATLTFKLMFLACSPLFGPIDIHSPSGHVAAATVVSGGLAAMLTRQRASILPVAVLAAIVIGISRFVLGMHSLPEVVVGALIGLAGAVALLRFSGPPPRLQIAPLIAEPRNTSQHVVKRRSFSACRGVTTDAASIYWRIHQAAMLVDM